MKSLDSLITKYIENAVKYGEAIKEGNKGHSGQ
jgi:hypothetical protein